MGVTSLPNNMLYFRGACKRLGDVDQLEQSS
jgi:hypothetical protein